MKNTIDKLRDLMHKREKNHVLQWWHSEFELKTKYKISIPNFPGSGTTQVLKSRTEYLVFPGKVKDLTKDIETSCDEIWFPTNSFFRAFERTQAKTKKQNETVTFCYKRLNNKYSIISDFKIRGCQTDLQKEVEKDIEK